MDNDLINEVIQFDSVVPSDYGVKINAQDKRVYNVSKTLKAGGISNAWQQMIDMKLKGTDAITGEQGSIVEIAYVESPNKHGGTSRYIRSFRETNEQPTSAPQQTEKPHSEPNIAPQSKQDETFWDKKAYKQCLWNYWLKRFNPLVGIDNGVHSNLLGETEMDMVYQVFNQIEKDAEERFSKEFVSNPYKPKGWDELGKKLKAEAEEVGGKGIHLTTDAEEVDGDDLPF